MKRRSERNDAKGSFVIQIVLRIIFVLWDENAEPKGPRYFQ